MDLNEFIFRDDTAEALGAGPEADDDFTVAEEHRNSGAPIKISLAVIGSAVVGLSHILGHAAKL
jgi:hypothetical protein